MADGVASIELNRPDKANAMNQQMWQSIHSAFRRVDEMAEVRVAVISGRGTHFTSGTDLTMLKGAAELRRLRWPFQRKAAPDCPRPAGHPERPSNAAASRLSLQFTAPAWSAASRGLPRSSRLGCTGSRPSFRRTRWSIPTRKCLLLETRSFTTPRTDFSQCTCRRGQIQLDNVAHRLNEQRIRRHLERFLAMWLEANGTPNAALTSTLSKRPSIN